MKIDDSFIHTQIGNTTKGIDRRSFLCGLAAAAAFSAPPLLRHAHAGEGSNTSLAKPSAKILLVGSGTPEGIERFVWNENTGELTEAGTAAAIAQPIWIALSPDHRFLYAACEVSSFDGESAGGIASFRLASGTLVPASRAASAGPGTCHAAIDATGRVLISADYGGGSTASFLCHEGNLGHRVWSEHYTGSGPIANRQERPHAHFASFSPDNRFAYINDLGSDCIHIYAVNTETAILKPAGRFTSHAGAGPRTLHFHPNGHTGYVVNELDSTVDVVEWRSGDGSLSAVQPIKLLPAAYTGPTRGCDTVITRDGRFVYFANRDNDFLYSFHADTLSGRLTPMTRTSSGGRTPRHFALDPTERWMLVANQDSDRISVFARNPSTGELASKGKSFPAKAPMCLVFV